MAKVAVIVVAAGRGERFGGNENKIFAKVDGQPLFLRSIGHFINREDVCQTILVISPAEEEEVGGEERDDPGAAGNGGLLGAQAELNGDVTHR